MKILFGGNRLFCTWFVFEIGYYLWVRFALYPRVEPLTKPQSYW